MRRRSRRSRDTGRRAAGAAVALFFLRLNSQLQAYHWQARSYAMHKSLDKLRATLREKTDLWVEAFMGRYGRLVLTSADPPPPVSLARCGPNCVAAYIRDQAAMLRRWRDNEFSSSRDSDLRNVMDEVDAALGRALYLLTLE